MRHRAEIQKHLKKKKKKEKAKQPEEKTMEFYRHVLLESRFDTFQKRIQGLHAEYE